MNAGQISTFVKAVHVELSHKRRNIRMFEVLSRGPKVSIPFITRGWTVKGKAYDNTLEKSAEGDMTKLSADEDHEIRCCMLESSSMLLPSSVTVARSRDCPPQRHQAGQYQKSSLV